MRIGLFTDTYPPEINGVANSTYILRTELLKQGHDVYVITTNSEGGVATHWEENGTILRFKGAELKFLYGYVMTSPFHFKALQEIKDLNLDVIHAQTEFGVGIFAHICASQLDIPLVSTYHTTYEDYTHYVNLINSKTVDEYAKKLIGRLSKLYGNSSVRVISPSEKTKSMLESYHIRRNIDVIPTGLMLDDFSPAKKDVEKTHAIRKNCGFGDDDFVIVTVGRLAEEKSVDVVVDAFEHASKIYDNIRLMIVGGGPDYDKIKKDVTERGLGDKVCLTGPFPKEEIPDIYRSAEAFISASLTETQGMTFIEALASGIPLFVRYDDVLAHLVDEGKTGWFYEDANDFTVQLKKYLSLSAEEKDIMRENCTKQVVSYSSQTFAEKVVDVYNKAIEEYHGYARIDDVAVRDSYVQLYLVTSTKEEKRLIVSMDDYAELGLRKGGMIPIPEIEELQEKQEGVAAYQSCIRRITVKDRTRKEMYDWLCKETKCDIRTINDIIDRLESKGYIDDERYCEEAVTSMLASFLGRERIEKDLVRKGLPLEMIQKAMDEHPDSEEEDAFDYAEKMLNGLKNDSVRRQKYAIRNKLLQRGYGGEIADKVLAKLDFSRSESRETENLKRCAAKAKHRYEKQYSGSACRNRVYRYCAGQGYNSEDIYAVMDEMEWNDD